MEHIDYSNGLISFEEASTRLQPYTCIDANGDLVKISVKNPNNHDSFNNLQTQPTYYYNLGYILANPDKVEPSTSNNPKSKAHMQEGKVLTYTKYNYIVNLNMPQSWQIQNDATQVIVKYTDDGNHSLTYMILRNLE